MSIKDDAKGNSSSGITTKATPTPMNGSLE